MLCICDKVRMRWKCNGRYTASERLKMRCSSLTLRTACGLYISRPTVDLYYPRLTTSIFIAHLTYCRPLQLAITTHGRSDVQSLDQQHASSTAAIVILAFLQLYTPSPTSKGRCNVSKRSFSPFLTGRLLLLYDVGSIRWCSLRVAMQAHPLTVDPVSFFRKLQRRFGNKIIAMRCSYNALTGWRSGWLTRPSRWAVVVLRTRGMSKRSRCIVGHSSDHPLSIVPRPR
jgi:hypothetical protein